MNINDWNTRWEQNQIGFHEAKPNQYLTRYFAQFNLAKNATVFVPLCGKSHDLIWLAQQGMQVYGIECSELAIQSFFNEHQLKYSTRQTDNFTIYNSGSITLFHGDFFQLTAMDLPAIDFIFDRASLVAFNADIQPQYLHHLAQFFNATTQLLLVTLHYDQSTMQGPPFSVDNEQVCAFYQAKNIQLLEQNEVVDETPRWRQVGLTSLLESVYKTTL